MTTNIDKVKILVVGDSGVGKTSLVHLISHKIPISNPSWTIGCSVEVKLHDYSEGTPQEKTYFVELWDIGGCKSHQNTRPVFYQPFNGIILVHDLTNRKSHENLRQWLAEIFNKHGDQGKGTLEDFDPEQVVGCTQVPILSVGTKLDQYNPPRGTSNRFSFLADEWGADEMQVDTLNKKSLAPGSSSAVKLDKFFNKVIERRYYAGNSNISHAFNMERRRVNPSYKIHHAD